MPPLPVKEAAASSDIFAITTSVPPQLFNALLARQASDLIKDPRELVKVEIRRVCGLCYNLDPYKAPPDATSNQPSWAHDEFKIPPGIRSAEVTINKALQLFETANKGCLYCSVLVRALSTARPDWEKEDSFIQIFLAANLPVFLHLGFGGTSNISIDQEQASRLGVILPEFGKMSLNVEFVAHGKDHVDIELFRPIIPANQITIGDVILGDLVQSMGFSKDIARSAGDPQCVDFIKEHVETCLKTHDCAQEGGALPLLPDRVIWIEAKNKSRIQLVEPRSIRARYIALSYCWGPVSPTTYLTNADTFQARKSGIEFTDLPPLFQDVVKTARALGIDYIWIDRLCIIQGDPKDFDTQAPKMGEIYGRATLSIAAASATTENDSIYAPREDKWMSVEHRTGFNGASSIKIRSRRLWSRLGTEKKGGDYGRISTRAWVWQERLLAARTVFFTPGGLKFECRRHSVWEGYGEGQRGNSWSNQLDTITYSSWPKLIEEFMGRNISRPSDRIPAIVAVAKRVQRVKNWTPCWGLWANNLILGLGWAPKTIKSQDGGHDCRPNQGRYAPTWSWASVDGPIDYSHAIPMGRNEQIDPMRWDVEINGLNPDPGQIRIFGHAMRIELNVTVRVSEAYTHDPTVPDKYHYTYRVGRDRNGEQGLPCKPDVALKPLTVHVGGQAVPTVVRVPYGEKPPEESWSGVCHCVMLGTRKLSSLVLLLGRSPEDPTLFERVGIVYGLPPSGFLGAKATLEIG